MLAELNQEYQDLLASAPQKYAQDLDRIYKGLEQAGIYYQGQVIPIAYQPLFFSPAEIKNFTELGVSLSNILTKVINKYLTEPEFRTYFDFGAELEELILVEPGYSALVPMGRFDIFYYGVDDFKLCELNTDGSSGMVKSNVLEGLFLESAAIKTLSAEQGYSFAYNELLESWVDILLECYREFNSENKKPNIAIIDFENFGMVSEFRHFKKLLEDLGYQTVIVDPRDLEYRKGSLYFEELRIDLIYRRAVTLDLMAHYSEITDLITAYKQQAVCLVGSFRSQIIHNKILFAILHDQEKTDFLTESEREFIVRYIPKTQLLSGSEQEKKYLIDNQEQLVLKPFDLYGAKGVYIGQDLSAQEWREQIDNLEFSEYLSQEFCPLPELEVPVLTTAGLSWESYKYILGLFMYDLSFKGIYTRAGLENVIASSTGCITLPNLIKY